MTLPTFAPPARASSARRWRTLGWGLLALGVAACTSVRTAPPGPRIARGARATAPAVFGFRAAEDAMAQPAAVPAAPVVARQGRAPAQPVVGSALPVAVRFDERVSSATDANPARSSHAIVVTVVDASGRPLPGQRVEWVLPRSPSAVGDLVGADDLGKVNNQYAVTTTNSSEERIDAANNHPHMDASGARLADLVVGPGQTWVTLSSAQEGVTDVLVYVPAIRDGTRNKVFARAVWADYDVAFPGDVTAALPDATRDLRVSVRRATDGESLANQVVEAEVLDDGVDAALRGGGRTATASTGADGTAVFSVENTRGARGVSRVRLTARGTFHDAEVVRSHVVEVRWQKAELECRVASQGDAVPVGTPFDAVVVVTNVGDAPAADARIDAELPAGLTPAEGMSFPVEVGPLAPGQTVEKTLRLVARTEGDHAAVLAVAAPSVAASSRCEARVSAVQGRLAVVARCEPAQVDVGGPVRFVVEVSNAGRAPLRNVSVHGVYPEGVTPKTAATIQIDALAPGASDAYEFLGVATRGGTFRNATRVTADGVAEASAECDVRVLACALEVAMTCPEWIALGEAASFRVRVTNTGDGLAVAPVLRVAHGACLDGGLMDVPLSDLPPGQTTVHEWQTTGVTNAKCAVSVEAVARGCEARAECEVEVGGVAAIDSTMSEQTLERSKKGSYKVGEEFLYVLELANETVADPTPPLRIHLTLPRELEFVSATSDEGVTVRGPASERDVVGVRTNAPPGAVSADFRLIPGQRVAIQYRVKVVAMPSNREKQVRAVASVQRATDGTELANETESTQIDK